MKLQEVCSYVVDKIDNSTLNINNYISTENMIPNCGGVTSASNVPDGKSIWFKEGDILFSNIRPYFKKLWKAEISGGCSADVLCIRANEKINPTYLYYLLIQDSFISYVMKGTKGCKMPRGDKKYNMAWDIDLPSLDVQKRIAVQLSEIDAKIAVNKKICENLEAQAQALFKHWFVDFEPFKDGKFVESELGLIPEGWRVGTLGDIIEFQNGYPFKSSSFVDSGKYKIITIKAVQDGKLVTDGADEIYTLPSNIPSYCILKPEDILLSLTGNVGRVCLVNQEGLVLNQRVCKLHAKESKNRGIIYALIRSKSMKNRMINLAKGTAQANLSPIETSKLSIVIPSPSCFDSVAEILNEYLSKLVKCEQESLRLSSLRDTLLPKLMSGQIKVNDIEI